MGLEVFNFWWFHGSEKLFFTTKLLIKHEPQKFEKISHTRENFGENYVTKHPAKILQDRIKPYRFGALTVSTGYNIFL